MLQLDSGHDDVLVPRLPGYRWKINLRSSIFKANIAAVQSTQHDRCGEGVGHQTGNVPIADRVAEQIEERDERVTTKDPLQATAPLMLSCGIMIGIM